MGDSETGQVSIGAAEVYEEFYLPALFQEWCPHALSAARVGTGHNVLDIACGTGALTLAAFESVGATGRAAGVDINEGMLEIAKWTTPQTHWATSMSLSSCSNMLNSIVLTSANIKALLVSNLLRAGFIQAPRAGRKMKPLVILNSKN